MFISSFFYFFLCNMIYTVTCKSHMKHRELDLIWSSGLGFENQESGRICGGAVTKGRGNSLLKSVQHSWKFVCRPFTSMPWLPFGARMDSQLLMSPGGTLSPTVPIERQ